MNGGLSTSLLELLCRPWQTLDRLEFAHTPAYHDKHVLHQKYVVEGLSIRQIADEFLSSREAVRKGLMDDNIPLRASGKPHGRQSQTKYGQRRINGMAASFMKEQKIIVAVRQMREQGLSLRLIAKNLSSMGIPTKCNGVQWHPEMVKRILS